MKVRQREGDGRHRSLLRSKGYIITFTLWLECKHLLHAHVLCPCPSSYKAHLSLFTRSLRSPLLSVSPTLGFSLARNTTADTPLTTNTKILSSAQTTLFSRSYFSSPYPAAKPSGPVRQWRGAKINKAS